MVIRSILLSDKIFNIKGKNSLIYLFWFSNALIMSLKKKYYTYKLKDYYGYLNLFRNKVKLMA